LNFVVSGVGSSTVITWKLPASKTDPSGGIGHTDMGMFVQLWCGLPRAYHGLACQAHEGFVW
jgi:hypothetical protein